MKRVLLLGLLALMTQTTWGQSVKSGSPQTLLSASTLTNVYQSTVGVDLQSYDSISVRASVPTQQAAGLAKIKPQWSQDGTNWGDALIATNAPPASGEIQQGLSSKVVILSLATNINTYTERFQREARYFRLQHSSTNVFTTGTMTLQIQLMNNQN